RLHVVDTAYGTIGGAVCNLGDPVGGQGGDSAPTLYCRRGGLQALPAVVGACPERTGKAVPVAHGQGRRRGRAQKQQTASFGIDYQLFSRRGRRPVGEIAGEGKLARHRYAGGGLHTQRVRQQRELTAVRHDRPGQQLREHGQDRRSVRQG